MLYINSLSELKLIDYINYEKISSVEIEKRDLETIPDKIYEFKNLKLLNLSGNLITSISPKIKNLINLEEIYLDRNLIEELPEEIGELKKLNKLILSNNNIKRLPDSFYNLENLEILNLSCNELYYLSDDISKMTKLEYIYLRNNKLRYIPRYLSQIKVVKLFYNSYENMDNLSFDCEYLQIENLDKPLLNLPIGIQEIRLYLPKIKKIKVPFGCKLYEDDILQNNYY